MSDIYNVLTTHDFRKMDIETLKETSCHSSLAFDGFISGLTAVGNLAFWATNNEDYDPKQAAEDLMGLGHMLITLPRIAAALKAAELDAELEIHRREGLPKC